MLQWIHMFLLIKKWFFDLLGFLTVWFKILFKFRNLMIVRGFNVTCLIAFLILYDLMVYCKPIATTYLATGSDNLYCCEPVAASLVTYCNIIVAKFSYLLRIVYIVSPGWVSAMSAFAMLCRTAIVLIWWVDNLELVCLLLLLFLICILIFCDRDASHPLVRLLQAPRQIWAHVHQCNRALCHRHSLVQHLLTMPALHLHLSLAPLENQIPHPTFFLFFAT